MAHGVLLRPDPSRRRSRSCRRHEDRIIAEAVSRRAAGRRACRAPRLQRSCISPSGAASASAQTKLRGQVAWRRLCRSSRCTRAMAMAEILGRSAPSAPNRCRARRPAHRPRGRNRRPARQAARLVPRPRAFSSALAAKVGPVSSGSGSPSSPRRPASMPCGASSRRSRAPCPDCGWRRPAACRAAASRAHQATVSFCNSTSSPMPLASASSCVELLLG